MSDTPLIKVPIIDNITALNVMVGFLNLAQRRGAYSFEESTKIYECIRYLANKENVEEAPPE